MDSRCVQWPTSLEPGAASPALITLRQCDDRFKQSCFKNNFYDAYSNSLLDPLSTWRPPRNIQLLSQYPSEVFHDQLSTPIWSSSLIPPSPQNVLCSRQAYASTGFKSTTAFETGCGAPYIPNTG